MTQVVRVEFRPATSEVVARSDDQPEMRATRRLVFPATLDTVNEEPEIYVIDFSDSPGAAEYRERLERARTEARQRYRDHLDE